MKNQMQWSQRESIRNSGCTHQSFCHGGFWIILFLLVLATSAGGCLSKLHLSETVPRDNVSNTPDPKNSTVTGTPAGAAAPAIAGNGNIWPEITPVKAEIVTEAMPDVTPDPYPVLHGTRINETPQFRFIDRVPEFRKSYIFRGNATGFYVNVVKGPLSIVYVVKPQNDCLISPDSCRGNKLKPVQRPYLTITVKDNETRQVVAEDGYGGIYSSDIGHYEVIMSGQNMDGLTSSGGSIGTNTVYPGPRRIMIYKEGVYHVTMQGNYLDVDLSIITGSSPDPLAAAMEKGSGSPLAGATPVPLPEEEGEWG